jgi:uncharacterized RDD family membrane protein YckC
MKSRSLEGHYAGFLSRAVGLILDGWVVTALVSAATYVVIRAAGLFGATPTSCRAVASLPADGGVACLAASLSVVAIVLTFGPIYYTLCWALIGQTIGQRFMGLRVLRLDGRELGLRRSFLRYIGYALCFVTLGVGFLWVLIDNRRMGWHDKLARTCVVYDWKAEQNEGFIAKVTKRFGRKRSLPPPSPETGS